MDKFNAAERDRTEDFNSQLRHFEYEFLQAAQEWKKSEQERYDIFNEAQRKRGEIFNAQETHRSNLFDQAEADRTRRSMEINSAGRELSKRRWQHTSEPSGSL